MPTGLQANNLSPMGFGQPNMRVAATQQRPGYGMPERPVAPGQQAQPKAPPGGVPATTQPPALTGVPTGLYQSSMAKQFPATAVYNRVQQAILNPGPPRPLAPAPSPQVPMAQAPTPDMSPDAMTAAMQFMQQQLGGMNGMA
jgi:hypothetical protein